MQYTYCVPVPFARPLRRVWLPLHLKCLLTVISALVTQMTRTLAGCVGGASRRAQHAAWIMHSIVDSATTAAPARRTMMYDVCLMTASDSGGAPRASTHLV
ncbi:hypothetical protein C8Q76DRAFT_706024, partial [Earliella scabrosa]